MLTVDLQKNYNGKLFCEVFSIVDVYKSQYNMDDIVQVDVRGMNWGTAKVVAMRVFPFTRLSNVESQISIGMSLQHQAELLHMKNVARLTANDNVIHLVLRWEERKYNTQSDYLTSYWQDQMTAYAD